MLLFITIFLSDFYFNITIFACIGINFKIVFVQIFLMFFNLNLCIIVNFIFLSLNKIIILTLLYNI
ncbi:hypothetical protein EUBVEN_02216 [Eubacterium ventriosum ATCC 27560]|uniref:Uncharacterized protein n=1 Tax=Eubacterium ventriosum ATCC 27560 TaxID=411463 RepID=A5Z923_9FIRM|nr:hypothetical protein EUBVEN_02216 [Eubacterium ventriosum ATCC 27560]